jgi:Zn-dependent peptidase ImmA (M78 family)
MLADEENGVEVRLVPLNAYHGGLWRSQGKWIVQLNANDTPARRRFTLFHEVFHIRAHLKTTPVFSKIGCKAGSFNENLADYFAACVLAPPQWVEKEWAKFKDIARMAAHFEVPYVVMFVMLKRVGLAVLLFSVLTLLASGTPFC